MIDVTGIDLVAFAKKVYDLSSPLGLGFLHYTPEPLSDEDAKKCIIKKGNVILSMDYVNGRACKMNILKERDTGKWIIRDEWYDHSEEQYKELLDYFNIRKN